MTRRFSLLAILFLQAGQAHAANFITGQRLYDMITDQDPFGRAQASGYIAGVTDANNGLGPMPLRWCYEVPNGVKTNQVFQVVATFLERNAAKRSMGAASLVEEALSTAYPCRK
jgi:hypothetical protein